MGKGKLAKFADMERYENVFQYPYSVVSDVSFEMRGHWREQYFNNDNPIVLELGCGRGEYAVGLAERYPDKNFIGVDIKVGEVMSVTQHPKNDKLMLCNVNLGKRAITVVTNDLNVKDDNKVGVSLLPPQAFSDIVSEGMFLGMNGSILKDVEGELGQMPKGIPMESLNETRNLVENYLK